MVKHFVFRKIKDLRISWKEIKINHNFGTTFLNLNAFNNIYLKEIEVRERKPWDNWNSKFALAFFSAQALLKLIKYVKQIMDRSFSASVNEVHPVENE